MIDFARHAAVCSTLLVLGLPAITLAIDRSTKTTHRGPPLPAKSAPSDAQRKKPTTADLERRKQSLEKTSREMQAAGDRLRSRMPADLRKLSGPTDAPARRGTAKTPAPPPFNPAAAPPAEECWRAYVAAAKQATAMDQLLNYLPTAEQKSLREHQANFDPSKVAAKREFWRQKSPDMSERSLTFLTNSPYANQLDHHKRVANKFLEVLSAKSDGNKATIVVSTYSATAGYDKYPYGKATIEMVGEAGYWRIDTYNDSDWYYQVPPIKP